MLRMLLVSLHALMLLGTQGNQVDYSKGQARMFCIFRIDSDRLG
jgi:hypothetical protein